MSLCLFALHMPDGFLPPQLSLIGWLLCLGPIAWAFSRTQRVQDQSFVPQMGMLAAFVFVAQVLQFPLPGGSSAHLQGSALAAIALGAWPSMVVLTSVVVVQGLFLGDGGLLVMGWNLFNMAVAGCLVASSLYQWALRRGFHWKSAAFAATWASLQFSSILACIELALAGTSPLALTLPAMGATQSLVGLGEALVTVAALAVLRKHESHSGCHSGLGFLVIALVLAVSLVPPSLYHSSGVGWLGPLPILPIWFTIGIVYGVLLGVAQRLWRGQA